MAVGSAGTDCARHAHGAGNRPRRRQHHLHILIGGGLFLLWKSVHEIHNALEGEADKRAAAAVRAGFAAVIVQIAIIGIVFSLDSVMTAVGMVEQVSIIVLAIVAAVGVMMFAAKPIGEFVDRHPTVKMLALSFLILVGMALIAEGWDYPIPKDYIYSAMAFSIAVEMLNIHLRARRQAAVGVRKHAPDWSGSGAAVMTRGEWPW